MQLQNLSYWLLAVYCFTLYPVEVMDAVEAARSLEAAGPLEAAGSLEASEAAEQMPQPKHTLHATKSDDISAK